MVQWNPDATTASTGQSLEDIDWRGHVVAACAGFGVGTFVFLWLGHSEIVGATTWLLVGVAVVSVWYKQVTGLLGACVALCFWLVVVSPLLTPSAISGNYSGIAEALPGFGLVCGCLVAAIAHAVGLPLRGPVDWLREKHHLPELRWLAIAAGVVSVALLAFTIAFVAPAASSFNVTLPAGWAEQTGFSVPDYERCYQVPSAVSSPVSGADFDRLASPSLCVSVVKFGRYPNDGSGSDSDAKWCYHAFDHGGPAPSNPMNDWTAEKATDSGVLAGAHEEIRVSDKGDRVYGFGLMRTRILGPITQQDVCYVVALTVPHGWAMTEGDVNTIVSAMRFS